jgi:hypothetical protein
VFRGISKDFPALFQVVSEANRVVIYDLTQPGAPMWRSITHRGYGGLSALTSLAYAQGRVMVGGTTQVGLITYDFIKDKVVTNQAGGETTARNLAAACNSSVEPVTTDTSVQIVNSNINDIAATVLADAPTDPATGLAVPTIAVACGSGNSGNVGSVISHSGAVVNYAQSGVDGTQVSFLPNGDVVWGTSGGSAVYAMPLAPSNVASLGASGARIYGVSTVPGFASGPYNRKTVSAGTMLACYGTQAGNGLHFVKENPSTPALGMVAALSATIPPAWQVGDSRGAWLIDTVAETISTPNLVTNGSFATDTTGWNAIFGTLSVVAGRMRVTRVGSDIGRAAWPLTCVVGATYSVSVDRYKGGAATSTGVALSINAMSSVGALISNSISGDGMWTATFVATQANHWLFLEANSGGNGDWAEFDEVVVKRIEPDRSVRNKGLSIIGSITKTLLGGIAMYSGHNGTNYQEIASTDHDYGTGDYHYMWWENVVSAPDQKRRFHRSVVGGGNDVVVGTGAASTYEFASGSGSLTNTGVPQVAGLHFMCAVRESGVFKLYFDGVPRYSVANTGNVTAVGGVLRIGTDTGVSPVWTGTPIALFRSGATAPSADQIAQIYRDELAMFQPGAQVTLAGGSNAVTALAYDDVTNATHALTSTHRSSFIGFTRYDSEALSVGTPSSISAQGGVISTAGSTSARIYMPALTLREELKRKDEARRALGKEPIFVDFDATASQTTFVATRGYSVKAVYSAGLLKRRGSGKDYTVTDDGYRKAAVFGTGLALNTQVTLMLVRD